MSIKFYSDYNLQVVNDNLDTIEDAATKAGYERMEPKQDEFKMIKQLILDYIIENKRIIYGGSAYHAIIQNYRSDKTSDNKIYQEWARYDIEFYSPDPVKDMVKICNKLNSAKVKHVMGRQAQHDETFTIFANFVQYCDISYMSQNVFDNISAIEINGVRYIHPEISLIDIFRMYNDPLTSSWRLKKTFRRMKLYMDKFPFDFKKHDKIKLSKLENHNDIINSVMPGLCKKYSKDVLFVGQMAYNIYSNPTNKLNGNITTNDINCIEIITQKPVEVGKYIKSLLYDWANKSNDGRYNDFETVFYNRFFQFWNDRVVIYYKKMPIFIILQNSGRCLPYNKFSLGEDKHPILVGSFLVTFNYYFIGYHYEQILKLGFYFKDRGFINSLLHIRTEYLDSNKKSVLDDSLYREFMIECMGETMEFGRESLLRNMARREKGIRPLSYDPIENYGDRLSYEFENSTGEEK